MRQTIILIALMLLFPAAAFAWNGDWEGGYDFEVDSIYYEIISESPPKVRVCSKTWWQDAYQVMILSSDYSGNLVIPNEVSYEDKTYAVTGIYWNAFFECGDLESITIPASVSNITITEYKASCIPNGKTGIKNITVAEGNTVFDSRNECNAVIMTATNRLVAGCDNTIIPNSVTAIGTSAFVGCKGITDVHIPSTITQIGKSAFAGCSNMINIEIPNSTTVEDYALANTGLTDIVWPNSMQSISEGAFQGCSNFVNIKIPDYITGIESFVFWDCSNLATVTSMASTPPRIENQTFNNYNATLYVPRESYNTYKTATGWKNFNMIFFIEPYYEVNGIFYSITSESTACVTYDENLSGHNGDIVIPEIVSLEGKEYVVNSIDKNAFYGSTGLTSIEIPSTVTTIGNNAFYGCTGLKELTWNAKNCPSNGDMTTSNIEKVTIGPEVEVLPSCFVSNSKISEVTIPSSISIIGDYAFRNCTGLLNVNIPDSVSTIGAYSFYGCNGLASLTIGKSVAYIGNSAFNNCNNLKELTWNAINCPYNGSMSTSNIENVTIGSEVEVLPDYFVSGSKIAEATIPNSVTRIGVSAFSECSGLTSIDIPNSVNTIGYGAFQTCQGITSVIIPNSVTTIGNYSFAYCSGLVNVSLGNSVMSLGDKSFEGCFSLSNITIPNSLTSIGEGTFGGCSSLLAVVIPNSVTSIGRNAFNSCNHLTSVTIGNAVSTIGHYAFGNCYRLMSVNIPSSVTTIGSNAFLNCNALSRVTISDVSSWCKITFSDYYSNPLYYSHHLYMNGQEIKQLVIPEGVTSIGNYAFVNGTSFLELTLPTTLESIGNYAFVGCKRLTNVSMGLSVTAIGSGAFKDCTAISSVTCMAPTPPTMTGVDCFDSDCYDWATLYVPGDKVEEYKSTIYWNKFANTFGRGIEVDGLFYLFDPDKGEATVTYKDETYCSYIGEVTIPETVNYGGAEYTVTGIGKAAFAYCDELTSVAIPHTVTSIGDYAFMYCEGLTSITIPDSVKSIGDNSFDGCGALCAVEIPNSVISIGNMAFQGCTSLTDITIGSGVTNIGAKAFNYCNSIQNVTCMGSVPPLMDNSDCFTSYGYEATLKVPHSSIEDYQSSNYWYKFAVIEGFGGVEPGDVDGDGNINISDVTALIDLLLSGGEALPSADVNGDGQVNISDVTALIDMLLSGN